MATDAQRTRAPPSEAIAELVRDAAHRGVAAARPALRLAREELQHNGFAYFATISFIGLTNGAVYALVALGYTLVYGILELINFAHGDVFMLGGMISATMLISAASSG